MTPRKAQEKGRPEADFKGPPRSSRPTAHADCHCAEDKSRPEGALSSGSDVASCLSGAGLSALCVPAPWGRLLLVLGSAQLCRVGGGGGRH